MAPKCCKTCLKQLKKGSIKRKYLPNKVNRWVWVCTTCFNDNIPVSTAVKNLLEEKLTDLHQIKIDNKSLNLANEALDQAIKDLLPKPFLFPIRRTAISKFCRNAVGYNYDLEKRQFIPHRYGIFTADSGFYCLDCLNDFNYPLTE